MVQVDLSRFRRIEAVRLLEKGVLPDRLITTSSPYVLEPIKCGHTDLINLDLSLAPSILGP